MDKSGLLRTIAEAGYNVGFGAKKHFATYDIVQKGPGWVAFISLVVGVYALIFEPLSSKFVGASIVVLGIAGLYITLYDSEKRSYEESGVKLTQLFNKLRDLYRTLKSGPADVALTDYQASLKEIESEYYNISLSKQILFSDWYAHYKFFWVHQIDWIEEQKNFSLMRDKIPLSFSCSFLLIALVLIVALLKWLAQC